MVRYPGHGLGQLTFYRPDATLLKLPAMKSTTVIFERNGNPTVSDRVICGQGLRIEKQESIR
jgi:hypothetical protein